MALGWLWWRAWARWVARGAAPLGVAGVALGDIHLRFSWQAWHLVTLTFHVRGRRGTCGSVALRHTPSFTHHVVTHHLSHTIFDTTSLTHHLSHHTTLSHTIFHTPSFTRHFVTHHLSHTTLSHTHLSHTTWSHTIFHTQLCHTLSFTHNFHTQLCHTHTHHLSLSHTIFHIQLCHTQLVFNFSILHHLLCLSFLPRPATTFVAHCWKKLACGLIRSFNLCVCVFVSLFVVVLVAPYWAHVEPC